jgi:hypothetical protein
MTTILSRFFPKISQFYISKMKIPWLKAILGVKNWWNFARKKHQCQQFIYLWLHIAKKMY